jgi:hypothetical protein
LVVYWALFLLHAQGVFEAAPRGDVADAAMVIALCLAFVVGVYVGRWSVLGLAATPVVVLGLLQWTGYIEPFHEPTPPLDGWRWWIAWCGVPLAFGVFIRRRALVPWPRPPQSPTPR